MKGFWNIIIRESLSVTSIEAVIEIGKSPSERSYSFDAVSESEFFPRKRSTAFRTAGLQRIALISAPINRMYMQA